MSKRFIIVDTGIAPTKEFIEKYDLEVMGMQIIMDDEEFLDYHEVDKNDFFKKIQTANEFHTAHPSIGEIAKIYESLKERGASEILEIHFSSKMTGLVNTCKLAKDMVNETYKDLKINILDTENISIGGYFVAEKCVELYSAGKSYEEILEILPEIKSSSFIQFTVPNLKYLIKNGRVGKAEGLAGTLLNIKPILGVDDALIAPINKVRGMKKVLSTMHDNAIKFLENRRINIKIYLTYGLDENLEEMNKLKEMVLETMNYKGMNDYEIIENRLDPTIACHSGPEVVGLAVYGEKEPI
jgi:DegV family protein with EDD domain